MAHQQNEEIFQTGDLDLMAVGFCPKQYLLKLRTGKLQSLDPAKAGKEVLFERKSDDQITIQEQLQIMQLNELRQIIMNLSQNETEQIL